MNRAAIQEQKEVKTKVLKIRPNIEINKTLVQRFNDLTNSTRV